MPTQPPALLVVEDDPTVAASLVRGLRAAGFEVELVTDGALAREALARKRPELMLLDLMLPRVSGFELLESLEGPARPPVIALTAATNLEERLRCFELGVVDYVPKPFFLEELVARIRARLRLVDEAPRRLIRWGGVELDLDGPHVRVEGSPVALTPQEMAVLAHLAQRPGRAVTREQLAENASALGHAPEPRTIDTHVARLRKKLGERGAAAVVTVWGIGYRFDPEAAP